MTQIFTEERLKITFLNPLCCSVKSVDRAKNCPLNSSYLLSSQTKNLAGFATLREEFQKPHIWSLAFVLFCDLSW